MPMVSHPRRLRVGLACLSFAAFVSACTNNKQPIVRVDVQCRAACRDNGVETRALEELMVGEVGHWAPFEFRGQQKTEAAFQLRGEIAQLGSRREGEKTVRSLGITVELIAVGNKEKVAAVERQIVVEHLEVSGAEGFKALAQSATLAAFTKLKAAHAFSRAPATTLVAALSSPDTTQVGQALRVIGQRKVQAAKPKLIELLKDESQTSNVHRLVVGALVGLKARDAAGAIIDAPLRRDPKGAVQIIYALAALGGPTARAYLLTVESGHPDPKLRAEAQRALAEMNATPR